MKLEKAIKIKEEYLRDNQPYDLEELEEADRLSIEALKVIKDVRPTGYGAIDDPLPGETKE